MEQVCICKEGTRSMLPFAEFLNSHGLRLGLWTWRGVHASAARHKLRVKGTSYTIDQIVNRNRDGTPCVSGRCPDVRMRARAHTHRERERAYRRRSASSCEQSRPSLH